MLYEVITMANIDFQKNKDPNRYNIAFLQYGEDFHFVVTNLNDPIKSYDNRTNFVDKIIINPLSSENCDCGRKGCVKSELSPSAIVKKAQRLFSREQTPNLYNFTDGDIKKVSIDLVIRSIRNGDILLKDMFVKQAELMAILINNLVFSTNPQKLVLHDFNFREEEFSYFKRMLENVCGTDISKLLDLSIIEPKHRFLSGAAIAVRELFFSKGGFDRVEFL